eukprot:c25654_g1_i1.p1 GENE.c25654_g1_i1~~c25654_g1_i1.p1  ORF type:complete len:1034 (+),score=291.92 c25654_g1_i1:43-3102(+)
MSENKVDIDRRRFHARVKRLGRVWAADTSGALFKGADILVFVAGKHDETQIFSKTSCLHEWLFGAFFSDTILVVVKEAIHLIASAQKCKIFSVLHDASAERKVLIHERSKQDNAPAFEIVRNAILAQSGKNVGTLLKEKQEGPFAESFAAFLEGIDGVSLVDAGLGVGRAFAKKDSNEQSHIRLASELCSKSMLYFKEQMEAFLTDDKSITHAKIAEMIEGKLLSATRSFHVHGVKDDFVDVPYLPLIMSGGNYNLKLSAEPDANNLVPGVIIASVGVRYASYCANVSRTYVIDAPEAVCSAYKLLVKAFMAGLKFLKPKSRCNDVYNAVLEQAKEIPQLAEKLSKSCGHGMGLEVKESYLQLTAKSALVIEEGMVFSYRVAFEDVEDTTQPAGRFSLLIADTILITTEGHEVLTNEALKTFQKVSYKFEQENKAEVSLEDKRTRGTSAAKQIDSAGRRPRPDIETDMDGIKDKQRQLAQELNEQAKARLLGQSKRKRQDGEQQQEMDSVNCYSSMASLPPLEKFKIFVDMDKECVLVPVNGTHVPFHISTIKNVTKPEELAQGGSQYTLRLNFVSPPGNDPLTTELLKHDKAILKQLSFRSTDARNLNNVFRQLKELRKRYGQRVAEAKDRQDLVDQADLVLCRGKPHARLRDLTMRPNMQGNRKTVGELQAHENGFRFVSNKGQHLDILFNNIRHAIFQPARNEPIVLLHFNLKNPIMMARKKLEDIQFLYEVMEASAAVGDARSGGWDDEHRDRMLKKRYNEAFKNFCAVVDEKHLLGGAKEFDIPFHELGFFGVAGKTTSLIQPTVNCLIDLIEWPATVITLSDIELVNLERVDFSIRNFDMVIVFKDYKRPVKMISSIDKNHIDTIKKWLNQTNIKFYEGKVNLQWPPILKHILADPKQFLENGGWDFLDNDAPTDDDDKDTESSEGFNPTESEDDEDSGSGSSVGVDEDEDESEGDASESEESGKDWDELEAEAAADDNEEVSEDESANRHKRQKTGVSSSKPSAPVGKPKRR